MRRIKHTRRYKASSQLKDLGWALAMLFIYLILLSLLGIVNL